MFYILHIVKIHLPIRGPAEMMSNYSQNLNRAFCHWTLYLADSYVLIFVKICIHYILIIFFVLSQIFSDPFNLLTHLDMGPTMECWWYTQWSLINENWFPFTQQISIANSFLVRGENFYLFPFSALRFRLVWTCAGLVCAFTISVNLYAHQSYCV